MKYAVWFVRLVYAAWMIPAGLNHFFPLYNQPTGNQPVSTEVFLALLDSGLFTWVKAVELLAGFAVLFGFRLPLLLLMVLPVSFTVWYWDTELQGWWTGSAIYGWSVLGCNLFLCLAYWQSYRAMFANGARPQLPFALPSSARLLDGLRLLLGAVLVITALRYFMPFLLQSYVPVHEWSDPIAARLMAAFDVSGLGAVARFIHIIAGLMLLTNRMTPFALAALLPVNLCGLYISLLIEGAPLLAAFAIAIVAVNGLLMLAHLPSYRGVLEGGALADGEGPDDNYNGLFANPLSKAPTKAYLGGALVLAAALAVYWKVIPFTNGTTGLVTLAVPAAIFAIGLVRSLARRGG